MAQPRKEQLILALERQREDLSHRLSSLQQELSPAHQLQSSLRKHPLGWAIGAAGSAFLATRLWKTARQPALERRKRSRLIWRSGKVLFGLARPALTNLALKKAREHLESRLEGGNGNSVLGASSQK